MSAELAPNTLCPRCGYWTSAPHFRECPDPSRAKPRAAPSDPSDLSLYDLGRELFRISNELQNELEGEAAPRVPRITQPHSAEFDRLARLAVQQKEEEERKLVAMTPAQRDRYIEEWAARVAPGMVADGCAIDRALREGNAAQAAPEIPPAIPSNVFGPRRPCRVCGDLTLFGIHDRCVQQEIDNERAAMDKNDGGPAGGCSEEES